MALRLVVPGLAVCPVVGRLPVVAVLVEVGRSLAVALVVRRSPVPVPVPVPVMVVAVAEVGRLSVPVVALLVVDRSLVAVESGRPLVPPVAAPCLVWRLSRARRGVLVPVKVVMPVWCRIRVSVVMPRLSRGRLGALVPGNVLTPR
ncbi:hypothetical protein [Amycolatopsis panacis]|uniref:hypothetical protein n=1 Tax=Amycolatopsis panacis TaxID=2340917 RepID=UPI001314BB47|nr:hypothetical protein [Amycolatopsis panacis]